MGSQCWELCAELLWERQRLGIWGYLEVQESARCSCGCFQGSRCAVGAGLGFQEWLVVWCLLRKAWMSLDNFYPSHPCSWRPREAASEGFTGSYRSSRDPHEQKFGASRCENPSPKHGVNKKWHGFVPDSPLCGGDVWVYRCMRLVEMGPWGLCCAGRNSGDGHK